MPVELSVVLPVVVNPAVLTVPIVQLALLFVRFTDPVLPATVAIELPLFVSVYVPPVPNSSRPALLINAVWVTVPVVVMVVFPVVVRPPLLIVSIDQFAALLVRLTEPVEPASKDMLFPEFDSA